MNLSMGSQSFIDVEIPLLWGTRAIVQDRKGRISIIDLAGDRAKIEVLGDKPAPGMEFVPTNDGFDILGDGELIYSYNPGTRTLSSSQLGLPDCEIGESQTRIGSSVFSGNIIRGAGVGIHVTRDSISMRAPLPRGLAEFIV